LAFFGVSSFVGDMLGKTIGPENSSMSSRSSTVSAS
jgi:hypothetical protein